MVESWTRSRSSGMKEVKQLWHGVNKERTKDSAQPTDRPKWRRAWARACQRGKEAKEKIENPSQDQPKWWRSGSVNLFGLYPYLYPCLYGHPCPCPYSCLSFPLWGGASLPFWGATVKKGVSWVRVEASPLALLDGPLPVPIVVWGDGLPFTGPCSKPAYTVRGGGVGEDGAPVEEDGSVSDEQLLKGSSGILRVGEVVACQIFIRLCIFFQNMRAGVSRRCAARRLSAWTLRMSSLTVGAGAEK